MPRRWCLVLSVLCLASSSVRAEESLSLSRVIELARARAPETVIARARIDETRANLVDAGRFATRNPVLDADVGRRWSDGRSTDIQTSLTFPLDLGGRRAKRRAVVESDVAREQHAAGSVERLAVATAISGYYQVLHADRRLALAEDRVRLADAAETTARQRARAGDVAEFEVNLARGEVARAKSGVVSAKADQARARSRLAALLGLSTNRFSVAGDLADRTRLEGTATATRSDLRALAKEIELARAEAILARSERWPSLDLRVTYERERDAEILLGGIAISLPIFEHGQGDAARARARARRAATELDARTTLATAQLEGARESYAAAVGAVQILEHEALPLSAQNETAAAASYRAGKIELGTLLVIRREVLDTRRDHLDRLLEAALAAVDLWIARGTSTIP